MQFVDSHVHIWDLEDPDTPHSASILGAAGQRRNRLREDYWEVWRPSKCIHVEALAADPQKEVEWLRQRAKGLSAIVAGAKLEETAGREALQRWGEENDELTVPVRGVRQILNWEEGAPHRCWPNLTFDLSMSDAWKDGLAQLNRWGLSFDLQCNPKQLERVSIAAMENHTQLIVNHVGLLQFDHKEPEVLDIWRQGLHHIARHHPDSSLKISMLTHLYASHSLADLSLVHEAIRLFGAHRCMFGSNSPVDEASGLSAVESMRIQHEITSCYDEESRKGLWYGAAERAYRLLA